VRAKKEAMALEEEQQRNQRLEEWKQKSLQSKKWRQERAANENEKKKMSTMTRYINLHQQKQQKLKDVERDKEAYPSKR
jgi:hypothetical protein